MTLLCVLKKGTQGGPDRRGMGVIRMVKGRWGCRYCNQSPCSAAIEREKRSTAGGATRGSVSAIRPYSCSAGTWAPLLNWWGPVQEGWLYCRNSKPVVTYGALMVYGFSLEYMKIFIKLLSEWLRCVAGPILLLLWPPPFLGSHGLPTPASYVWQPIIILLLQTLWVYLCLKSLCI